MSAEVDYGLWDKPHFNICSFLNKSDFIENKVVENVEIRFNIYEGNFMEPFNH